MKNPGDFAHDFLDSRGARSAVHACNRQRFVAKALRDGGAFIARKAFKFFQRHQIRVVMQAQLRLAFFGLDVRLRDAGLRAQALLQAHDAAVARIGDAGQHHRNFQLQNVVVGRGGVRCIGHNVFRNESDRREIPDVCDARKSHVRVLADFATSLVFLF